MSSQWEPLLSPLPAIEASVGVVFNHWAVLKCCGCGIMLLQRTSSSEPVRIDVIFLSVVFEDWAVVHAFSQWAPSTMSHSMTLRAQQWCSI